MGVFDFFKRRRHNDLTSQPSAMGLRDDGFEPLPGLPGEGMPMEGPDAGMPQYNEDPAFNPAPRDDYSGYSGRATFNRNPMEQQRQSYDYDQRYNQNQARPDLSSQPPQQQREQYSNRDELVERDIQIISSKIDAIKAGIDNINQRLENIERATFQNSPRRRW